MENGQTSVQQLNILYIEKNSILNYREVDIKSVIDLLVKLLGFRRAERQFPIYILCELCYSSTVR